MKVYELLEARRNPHLNPRIAPLEQLQRIAQKYGTRGIYVRFTNTHKIGINPQPKWGTPAGVCAYPLKYVIDSKLNVSFAGEMQYMFVFKLKSGAKILDLNSPINHNLIDKWLKSIDSVVGRIPRNLDNIKSYRDIWLYMYDCIRKKPHQYGSGSRVNSEARESIKSYQILKRLGLNGVEDLEAKVIDPNELQQAIFFNTNVLQIISVIDMHLGVHRFKNKPFKNTFTSSEIKEATQLLNLYHEMCDEESDKYAGKYFNNNMEVVSLLQVFKFLKVPNPERLAACAANLKLEENPENIRYLVHPNEATKLTNYGMNFNKYFEYVSQF